MDNETHELWAWNAHYESQVLLDLDVSAEGR